MTQYFSFLRRSKVSFTVLILFLLTCSDSHSQEVSFKIPINLTNDFIVVIDSSFKYQHRYRENLPYETREGKISKIFLERDETRELILEIKGGVYEIISIYYDQQQSGGIEKSFSILYRSSKNTPIIFLSSNCITLKGNSVPNNCLWVLTTASSATYFSSIHTTSSEDRQVKDVEWLNSKVFRLFYHPARTHIGYATDSTTNKREKLWKTRRDPIAPSTYAEIDGQLIKFDAYNEVLVYKKENMILKSSYKLEK